MPVFLWILPDDAAGCSLPHSNCLIVIFAASSIKPLANGCDSGHPLFLEGDLSNSPARGLGEKRAAPARALLYPVCALISSFGNAGDEI